MLEQPEEVTVYRVEHRYLGVGPYRECFYDDFEAMHIEHSGVVHPAPLKDGMEEFLDSGMLFGFKDMEQLDDWFELKFKILMHEYGFIIREYVVPVSYVEYGGHQIAFDQEQSVLSDEKNLVEPLVS